MNNKIAIKLLLILFMLCVLTTSSCFSEDKDFPFVNNKKQELTRMVWQTILWYSYWEGALDNKIINKLKSENKIVSSIGRCQEGSSCYNIYIDDLFIYLWIAKYSVWQPGFLECVNLSQNKKTGEAIIELNAYKKKDDIIIPKYEMAISKVDADILNFGNFDIQKEKIAKVLIEQDVSENDTLKFFKTKFPNSDYVNIIVGNFNRNFPWLYYYLESTDYIGEIYFNIENQKIIHSDLFYIKENVKEQLYVNTKKKILENGKMLKFSLKTGKFVSN